METIRPNTTVTSEASGGFERSENELTTAKRGSGGKTPASLGTNSPLSERSERRGVSSRVNSRSVATHSTVKGEGSGEP